MKELNNYIVNLETLLLIPVDDNKTKVFEMEEEFLVKKNIMTIIKDSCLFFGSSFEGRKEGTKYLLNCGIKVPIIIEDSRSLILFPTFSDISIVKLFWFIIQINIMNCLIPFIERYESAVIPYAVLFVSRFELNISLIHIAFGQQSYIRIS